MTNLNREQVTFFILFNLIYKDMCFESYLNLFVLIFAQGHFTRNFFSIIYLKQMKREAKFKEYGI